MVVISPCVKAMGEAESEVNYVSKIISTLVTLASCRVLIGNKTDNHLDKSDYNNSIRLIQVGKSKLKKMKGVKRFVRTKIMICSK